MSNLTVRILTAIVAGGGSVAAMILSPWGSFAFCVLIAGMGLIEFYRVSSLRSSALKVLGLVQTVLAAFAVSSVILNQIETFYITVAAASILLLYPLGAIFLLFDKEENQPLVSLGTLLVGIIWVVLPPLSLFVLGSILPFVSWPTEPYQGILGILFLTWTTDSMAYFGGRFLGKHKLFERISPKKTWEGSIIGLAFCLLLGYLLNQWWPVSWNWMIAAGIIGSIGQLGDLVESMIKRSLDLKDSGSLLPGHGGILDRFDGLYLSMPFLLFYGILSFYF